jgi:hypothetical protein
VGFGVAVGAVPTGEGDGVGVTVGSGALVRDGRTVGVRCGVGRGVGVGRERTGVGETVGCVVAGESVAAFSGLTIR